MSLKEKLASLLFGSKAATEAEDQIQEELAVDQTAETKADGSFDQALLELPAEHPL